MFPPSVAGSVKGKGRESLSRRESGNSSPLEIHDSSLLVRYAALNGKQNARVASGKKLIRIHVRGTRVYKIAEAALARLASSHSSKFIVLICKPSD